MKAMRRAYLVAMVFALVGCSSGSSNPASSWGGQFAAAMCARIFACCNATDAAALGYTSESQCASTAGAQEQMMINQVLAASPVRYDGDAAATCLADIAASSCTSLFSDYGRPTTPLSCGRVFVGTLQTGAPCGDLDFYCQSDACESGYCAAPSCRTVVCPAGQYCDATSLGCVPGQAAGASCASNAQCDPSIVCRAGTCGAPLPDQSACAVDTDCVSGACVPSSGQTSAYVCGAPLPDGSPCTGVGQCQSGACNTSTAGATCGAPLCTG
jgi:hypothetical protein